MNRYDKWKGFVISSVGNREIRQLNNQVLGVYLVDLKIVPTEVLRVQLGKELKEIALAFFALLKELF